MKCVTILVNQTSRGRILIEFFYDIEEQTFCIYRIFSFLRTRSEEVIASKMCI